MAVFSFLGYILLTSLKKLLALDSEQDELLYRICKFNLYMCQAHANARHWGGIMTW